MNDISDLEERAQSALSIIDAALNGIGTAEPGDVADGADAQAELAERDAKINNLSKELADLRTQLQDSQDNLKKVEDRRRADMAELDEIIEQLEPLMKGSE